MGKKKTVLSAIILFSFAACSGTSSESDSELARDYEKEFDYDEEFFALDSLSKCVIDPKETDSFYKIDSVFIETKNKEQSISFPSQIYCSKHNIKSIGVYDFGDTLKVELIEKGIKASLDCPVWVYATSQKTIEAKYIKTSTGVYPLGKK
ncbi:hypothetical protein J6W78_00245 [bacterium]|nr:hypothetical protein [bacterium]